jgi:hypothetical protein
VEELGIFFFLRIRWLWYQPSHPVAAGEDQGVRPIQGDTIVACGEQPHLKKIKI